MSLVNCSEDHADESWRQAENGRGKAATNALFAQMEAPWANSKFFLMELVGLLSLASIVGVLSFCYNYVVSDLLDRWLSLLGDRDYAEDSLSLEFMEGATKWIPAVWGGCTLVGVLKCALGLDTYPSFIEEIRSLHVDPHTAWKVCLCCMGTLFSGAAMGPEAGLAAGAAGLGVVIANGISAFGGRWAEEAEERRKLFALAGIGAAFGTILPAPWVSLLICVECSFLKTNEEGTHLVVFGRRTLFLIAMVCSTAFVVRYAVAPIQLSNIEGTKFEALYDNNMPLKATILGALGAASALVYAVIGGIVKQIFSRLASLIERCGGSSCRIIAMCSLAGLLTGLIGYAVPFALTDGKSQIAPTLFHGAKLSLGELLSIAVAKAFAFHIAQSGGLVGGPFFPILYIGIVMGEVASRIPGFGFFPAFTVPVVTVSVPGALFPLPFTLVSMMLSMFKLGPLWCVSILVGLVVSYTLVVGSGFAKRLAK